MKNDVLKKGKVLPFDSLELSSDDVLMLEDMMYIIGGGGEGCGCGCAGGKGCGCGCGCKDEQAPPEG